jgi:antitoxin (DNA-binding transcriptional repressor) of toxin-antitoxin stability system
MGGSLLRRVAAAFTVATAGMAAAAATSQASTVNITPVKPCYITRETDTLSGTGYTPGGTVGIAVDGLPVFDLVADSAGAFTTSLQFGTMRAVKTHTLSATDRTNPALNATVSFVGTTHQVTVKPSTGRAGKKRKMRGYGFINGPKAYMHVRGHGIRATTLVGRPSGVCGTWGPTRKRIVPSTAASGDYRVQFDARRKYSKKTRPRLVYKLSVFRTFHSAAFAGAAMLRGWTKVAG